MAPQWWVGARELTPFESVEDVWRRSGVPRAAIEKLADADAFHADRRQGLWKARGHGEAPLPLFAAADRAAATISAEGLEPDVTLRPLTDGREVIEDYRSLQLSLRAHPLTFVRDELACRGVARCADLATVRDGRHVQVAGIIVVRQKPGSAKGVLFINIEDETGIANGILWPDRFEKQRRTVMSASMIGMRGRVQKEGEVIHVICGRIIDHGDLLTQVGQMSFPHPTGRCDGAGHAGSPDHGDKGWSPEPRNSYWPPHADGKDPEDVLSASVACARASGCSEPIEWRRSARTARASAPGCVPLLRDYLAQLQLQLQLQMRRGAQGDAG